MLDEDFKRYLRINPQKPIIDIIRRFGKQSLEKINLMVEKGVMNL
jgi:hypothetical protein